MTITPNFNDYEFLRVLTEQIGSEPREAEFDPDGYLVLLNLAGLNLSKLPIEIGLFLRLKHLILGESAMVGGEEVHLGNNLVELPPEIGRLINLETLDLRHNNLTSLPSEIRHLTKLIKLDLWNNKLSSLPAEIGFLRNLEFLDPYNNKMTHLPSEIGNLLKLKFLGLSRNQLSTLPPEIGKLKNLEKLYLKNNNLTEYCKEISDLTNLKHLHLGGNTIATIPEGIGNLKKLQRLNLKWVKLKSIPKDIIQLSNLSELYLAGNKLNALPQAISQMKNLVELDLRHNLFSELPVELAQLTNLQYLDLDGNPLRTPPPEIVDRGTKDIFDFLQDLSKAKVTRYETKLLIVGEGGSGKTSLLRALKDMPFDQHLTTTHGINVEPYILPHPKKDGVDIKLNVWDFGGQQIYHTTHQFFLTNRSLYLLVWNSRVDTDQARLDHWLRNIHVLAPEVPVLLVATHIDERPADFNYARYEENYPQLIGHVGVSNKAGTGIQDLKELIANEAVKIPLMQQIWPQTWINAETALNQTTEHHFTLSQYTNICVQQGVTNDIARTAFGSYLHDLGKILYYQDDDTLSDFVVLKPNWLTRAISRVLDDDIIRASGGILNHEDFSRIWDVDENGDPYERRLYPLFLRLMERFLISFQLERKVAGKLSNRSLVPLLLSHTPPSDMSSWEEVLPNEPEIKMVFRLSDFVPPGIMSWFITLTHVYTQGLHWREGVRLQYEGHQAQVELNPSNRELWLHVRGPAPSNFFNILQHTISDRILEYYFEGLTYTKEVPCNCHTRKGQNIKCLYFHDYERLVKRLKKGKLTAECGESFEEVSVPELLEGIHYSTNDRVAAKLELGFQHLEAGQHKIINISTTNQEIILQNRQLHEQLNRSFNRLWNLQMANMNTECPNTFIIMPGDRQQYDFRNIFDNGFNLYLICQYPSHPHIIPGESGYPLKKGRDWWATVSPWLKRLMEYLRYVPKVRSIAKAYDEEIFNSIEASLKLFDAIIKEVPEIKSNKSIKGIQSDIDRFNFQEVEGPALRILHSFLKEVDLSQRWCGLHKTVTNDGNIFWLCDEHRKFYELF